MVSTFLHNTIPSKGGFKESYPVGYSYDKVDFLFIEEISAIGVSNNGCVIRTFQEIVGAGGRGRGGGGETKRDDKGRHGTRAT